MRIDALPSPGILTQSIRLRTDVAKAISAAEVNAMHTPGGKTTSAKVLSDFFSAAVTALAGLYDVTVTAFSGVTSAVASSATTIKITFAETMDTGVAPLPADFAISGDTITAVAWGTAGDAGKLILTGTGFAAAETLAYTKPAVNALRDRAGNQMASGTKAVS